MTYRTFLLSLLLVAVLAAGCAGTRPSPAPLRVVVLGSSTAEGAGPSHPDSTWVGRYRAHVQRLDPRAEVINLARGGYVTTQVLPAGLAPAGRPQPDTARNVDRALALRPSVIVVNLPTNDAASGITPAETMAHFRRIVGAAVARGVPVWVATTQPRNLDAAGRARLVAVRDSIRAAFAPRVIDFWTGLATPDGRIDPAFDSGDGIHLNDAAHRLLFERVRAAAPERAR